MYVEVNFFNEAEVYTHCQSHPGDMALFNKTVAHFANKPERVLIVLREDDHQFLKAHRNWEPKNIKKG